MKKTLLIFFLLSVMISSGNATVINPTQGYKNLMPHPSLKRWRHNGAGKMQNNKYSIFMTNGVISQKTLYYMDPSPQRYNPDGIIDRVCSSEAQVKGTGKIRIGIETLVPNLKQPGAWKKSTVWSKYLQLSKQWQKIQIKHQELNPYCYQHCVKFEMEKAGEATIKQVDFHYWIDKTISLSLTPRYIFAAPGDEINVKYNFSKAAPVKIRTYSGLSGVNLLSTKTVNNGTFKVKIPENSNGYYRICISSPQYAVNKVMYVTVVPKAIIKQIRQTVAKIKLAKPLNVLYLGDSLTDMKRGSNYLNMVDYFFDEKENKGININNVAVCGDFSSRVWDRICRKPTYRRYMYFNLFQLKPDIIFIFLGANDTKASKASKFTVPLITPKVQKEKYQKIINFLREKTNAKIVLVGCPSFNSKRCREHAKKLTVCFGIDKHIINFNKVIKELCKEYNADYINLFDKTKALPNKNQLYNSYDGIHLTAKGNEFMALEILNYLASKFPK